MEAFEGKYERISVENLDEFLKEMGVKNVILFGMSTPDISELAQ